MLPKDYEGNAKATGCDGLSRSGGCGFFGRSPSEVKQAMEHAGLHCVSAPLFPKPTAAKVDETIQFGQGLGLGVHRMRRADAEGSSRAKDPDHAPRGNRMTLDDWRWMRINSIALVKK